MTVVLWAAIFFIFYCYIGYPTALWCLAKIKTWPVKKSQIQPAVSIVLAVHNEEDVIQPKVQNLLALDYPKKKMEILFGSDGSTDQTNELIRWFRDPRIRLFAFPQRRGKMLTINDLVEQAKHEVIVFTDARQSFAVNAVQELVNNFADERVGCVSGELIFSSLSNPSTDQKQGPHAQGGGTAKGINLYWEYEKFIRDLESRIHSMLGATGAIYAIRKRLFTPVPRNMVLDDMFIPLKIIEKGYRAIFDNSAKAYDQAADKPREEYKRKTRTLYGNYQIFGKFLSLFNPFKSPVAIQLFSHKFLRVMVPFLMILVFLANIALLGQKYYLALLILQILFYTMAVLGALFRNNKYGILKPISKACYVPYVFCLLNFSALIGFLKFLKSSQEITWEKAREH